MNKPIEVRESNFEVEVLRSIIPVLADFYAPWSPPCLAMKELIEGIAERYNDKLKMVRINIDEADQLAEVYRVSSLPTLLLLDRGTARARIAADFDPRMDLSSAIDEYLSPSAFH